MTTGMRRLLRADEVNSQLRELYLGLWPRLMTLLPDDASFSNPLLLKVGPAYCNAPHRILVIGQQTDTWYNQVRTRDLPDPVATLMDIYEEFDLARPHPTRRRSPYWWASHHVSEQLNGAVPPADFVWSDLVRIDDRRARSSQQMETELCALGMLRREIEILAPDVVLFFTGPRYEERLRETFPGVGFTQVSPNHPASSLARITHESLPVSTFRTYHPGYLQRSGGYDVIRAIPALIA